MFGDNGARLDHLSDLQLAKELKDKRLHNYWMPPVFLFVLSMLYLCFHRVVDRAGSPSLVLVCFLIQAAFLIVPPIVVSATKAVESGHLPVKPGGRPRWQHMSGVLITFFAVLLLGIVWTARWAQDNYDHLVIDGNFGLLIVGAVAFGFVTFIVSPRIIAAQYSRISRLSSSVFGPESLLGRWFHLVSRISSTIDSWLVYIIAPVAGVTQKRTLQRYGVMAGYLSSCALMAWYLPAPTGLFAVGLAFLLSISVSRRWAWVESDREMTLRNPKYKPESLRVGLEQDLRDEALLALLSLMVFLPLAMRQLHFSDPDAPIFFFSAGASDSPLAWMQMFGVELAKAVPFVDWADIYNVKSQSPIQVTTAMASHVVFAARAVVDLLFLSTLLQAISISVRLSAHKRLFFEKEIDLLDPIIERFELERLAFRKHGAWAFTDQITRFTHYDTFALSRVRSSSPKDGALWAVASELLRQKGVITSTPGERFLEAACQPSPRLDRVYPAFIVARDANDLSLEALVLARRSLNRRPSFTQVRTEIVSLVIAMQDDPARTTALRHTLAGSDADSVANIRLLSILPLAEAAASDQRARKALEVAASRDGSRVVRQAAKDALSGLPDPAPLRPTSDDPANSAAPTRVAPENLGAL